MNISARSGAQFSARIPRDLFARLQYIADKDHRSFNYITLAALAGWLAAPDEARASNPARFKACGAEAETIMLRMSACQRDDLRAEARKLASSMNTLLVMALDLWAETWQAGSMPAPNVPLAGETQSLVPVYISKALSDRICSVVPKERLSALVEKALEEQFPAPNSETERQAEQLRNAAGLLRCLLAPEEVDDLDRRMGRLDARQTPSRAAAAAKLTEWIAAQLRARGFEATGLEAPAALRCLCLHAVSAEMQET